MTNQKPTGVFVRLRDGTLSEDQINALYNPKRSGTENLLAIGTPVQRGELEAVGWARASHVGKLPRFHAISTEKRLEESVRQLWFDLPLVRQSEAQVAIAAVQAENARLRGALTGLLQEWEKLTRYGSPLAKQANPNVAAAKVALKDGAA